MSDLVLDLQEFTDTLIGLLTTANITENWGVHSLSGESPGRIVAGNVPMIFLDMVDFNPTQAQMSYPQYSVEGVYSCKVVVVGHDFKHVNMEMELKHLASLVWNWLIKNFTLGGYVADSQTGGIVFGATVHEGGAQGSADISFSATKVLTFTLTK